MRVEKRVLSAGVLVVRKNKLLLGEIANDHRTWEYPRVVIPNTGCLGMIREAQRNFYKEVGIEIEVADKYPVMLPLASLPLLRARYHGTHEPQQTEDYSRWGWFDVHELGGVFPKISMDVEEAVLSVKQAEDIFGVKCLPAMI